MGKKLKKKEGLTQKVEGKQGFSLIQTRFRRKLSKKDSREFTSGAKLRYFFSRHADFPANSLIFILNVFFPSNPKRLQQLLPVPAPEHVAEVLEPERCHAAGNQVFFFLYIFWIWIRMWNDIVGLQKLQVPRARPNEIVASRDDGGGDLVSYIQ